MVSVQSSGAISGDDLFSWTSLMVVQGITWRDRKCERPTQTSFLLLLFLLCWVWVHCSTYKVSYNVLNILEFPLNQCSTHPLSPDSWNSFHRYRFCIYIRVYTLFAPYSSSFPYPQQNLFSPPVL
jgi:hypothetical protein